jgi:hypothetical protein
LQNTWFIIENNVNSKLQEETRKHYDKLNNKLDKLTKQTENKTMTTHETTKQTFYQRLYNMTNVKLSKTEENLLNKGSKYNMGIVPKKCIKQLVCETENAIRQLNINQQEALRYLATKDTTNYNKTQHDK